MDSLKLKGTNDMYTWLVIESIRLYVHNHEFANAQDKMHYWLQWNALAMDHFLTETYDYWKRKDLTL
jgi:hypothetical protein